MRVGCGALCKGSMVAGCLFLALQPSLAQNSAQNSTRKPADTPGATRSIMVEKGHALEARGRPDLAIQVWQQVLLSDPKNVEALAGLARDLKLIGSDKAIDALDRLRKASPNDPNIAKIQGLASTRAESAQLRRAGELARQGKTADAMSIYKQLYGNRPPDGDIALAYYQALYGTPHGKQEAITAMRALAVRNPGDPRFAVELGAMLTHERKTRTEGIRILRAHPKDLNAQAALRQALAAEPPYPAAAGESHARIKEHAQDTKTTRARKTPTVEDAQATSHFSSVMSEATQAFNQNQFDVASSKYREALTMKPRSPEALNGLAGMLTKQQQYTSAALIYDQLTKVQPNSTDGWRGLFLSYARDNQNQNALAVEARFPASVETALAGDPEYLRTLATIYLAENRAADAQSVLAQAMSLPFPDNGTNLKADTKLDYAGILRSAKHYDRAVALYTQMLTDDPGNLSAWEGLVSAHHEMGQDTRAIDDVQKMQPAIYEAALADSGFLTMLGAIYRQTNQYEVAQSLLERAAKLQISAGGQPSVALQLQLAGIYLLRNDTAHAYDIYHQVLQTNPDRADAWKGLIVALLATNRNTEALLEIVLIPAPVRKELDSDIEFVQDEASVYAATGDIARATEFMNRVQTYYAKLHTDPPAAIEIQNAWLLFNTGNDRALYPALMRLGSRPGLTVAQRETIQDIWANWSVRRASAAMDNGNVQRAVDILDAASQAFPDNLTVRKAVAGGYEQVGRAKESLALYKTISMQDASDDDFQGAIGAALAANDKNQAELWLRQALERFPRDPAILNLAARYEQARGDNQRAAGYYRAALAAAPPASPAEKLAHVLDYPDRDTKARRAVTAADLQQLLDPNCEPLPKTTRLPPFPVVLGPTGPRAQQSPIQQIPATMNRGMAPQEPVYVPQSYARLNQQRASHRGKSSANGPRLIYATFSPRIRPTGWAPQVSILRPGNRPLQAAVLHAALAQSRVSVPKESQASDTWKGLIVSLLAINHNAEALQELAKIPPDIRVQLEADVEFMQAEADLYLSVGDIAHAAEALNHEEKLYQARHAAVPAAVELKHAFLLDNLLDDHALRPLLQRLDARADLNPSQRRQIEGLWSHYAARQPGPQALTGVKASPSASPSPYEGKMKLPPSEETVDSTEPVFPRAASQAPRRKSGTSTGAPNPAPPLRIAAQPMGPLAAQAQALFADQTDGQLTQGSAAVIHNLANAAVNPLPSLHTTPSTTSQYNVAQYTPSAQEAATGAYSAPRQQQPQPTPPASTQPLSTPPPVKHSAAHATTERKRARTATAKASQQGTPTLGQAPEQGIESSQQTQAPPRQTLIDVQAPTSAPTQAPITDTGLSDEELQQRNLPPLRGPWVRIQRQPNALSPREEAEIQLHSIEAGYSPWLGGSGILNYRSGSSGYDHLAALEAPFEASMPLGLYTRLSIVAKPVFLDSGQADGASVITVQESTTAGTALVTIPQPMGTLTATATTPPAQQNAVGIGGEMQMAFPHLALAGGYTPEGFLVATFTGRAYWKPANGPFTFNFSRDPVRDTQLSYAGLRDPAGNTLGNLGQIWGGVVANQGQVQFAHGDAESGFYFGAGGQYLTGSHVQTNTRIDGSGGANWRIKTMPEYGSLSIGANFFGMHYQHNEGAFTHGMGGYFSPQSYFLANMPFAWAAHYGARWHYNILGSLGVQAFQEDLTPLWPLAVDKPLETAMNNAMLPAKTSVGPNYDLRSQVSYEIGPHWFAGGFIGANNSRNYSWVNAGFSVHYMFRTQPSTAAGPSGIFPIEGVRPFTVP